MAVTLTSTTQSDSEMAEALAHPRYNLTPEPPAAPVPEPAQEITAPAAETPAEVTPAEPPAEGKTETAPEAVETQEDEEDKESLSEDERKTPLPASIQKKIDRKINRLTRQRFEEKGKREASESRIRELEAKLAEAQKPPAAPEPEPAPAAEVKPPAPEPKPKPKAEDFPDSYDDFIEALVDWKAEVKAAEVQAKADEKIAALESKLAEADTKKEQEQVANDIWGAKVEKAKAKIPDIETVMASKEAQETQVNQVMHNAILKSAIGPEIGVYLVQNPEECKRIFAATALTDKSTREQVEDALMTAGYEFRRIEEKLTAAPVAPPPAADPPPVPEKPKPAAAPPVSNAPAPITPASTRSATTVALEPPKDPSEYLKWREAQIKKRTA